MTTLRLAWRMQRWELIVLVGGSLLLAAAMAIVAWQLDPTIEALQGCYGDGTSLSPECRSLMDWGNLLGAAGAILPGVALMVPFVAGILLGAPLVAREIEKRTAPMAWSLSRSRVRWLAGRLLPVVLSAVVSLLAVGAASEALLVAARPDSDLSFPNFGYHGPIIAARGLAVMLIGVVVGLILGRMLPAILVTGMLTIALIGGLTFMRAEMMRNEATWVPSESLSDFGSGVMVYDQAWTDDATGEFLTYDQAFERFPEEFGPEGSWMPPGLTQVYLMTPPEVYPAFVAREIAALLGVAVLAAAGAAWVIGWRRPE